MIKEGDLCKWLNYTQYGWRERQGRVTRILSKEVWEVCGNFGVLYIDPVACGIERIEQ
jgi:hypothetical protein